MVSHALIYIFGAILNLTHITLTLPDTLYKQGFNYPTPFVPRGGMTFRVLPKVKSFLKFQLCWDLCARQPPFLFFSSWERVRKGLGKKKKKEKAKKTNTQFGFYDRVYLRNGLFFLQRHLYDCTVPHSSAMLLSFTSSSVECSA